MSWAETEFETADFGDSRLKKRVIQIASRLSENPTGSIPAACRGWLETKSTYRFFDNDKVTPEKILLPHIEATMQRMQAQQRVLLIQDTTELDYSKHFCKEGIGYLNWEPRKGLYVHPLLAVTEDRLPLGLVGMNWWARETLGPKARSEERAIEEKESYRWLLQYQKSNKLAQSMPNTHLVVIGDRESDIYELLSEGAKAKQTGLPYADILVRSSYNRRIENQEGEIAALHEAVQKTKTLGRIEFEFQPRKGLKKRKVRQQIRATQVTILPTQKRGLRAEMEPFVITIVHAKEIGAPKEVDAIEWFLLTTAEAENDFKSACQVIEWYLARWDIELYFKALKSGCTVEDIQLEEEQRFLSCLTLYMVIAWRIIFLVKIARTHPKLCCTEFLSEEEWRTAYIMIKKKKPKEPPTIAEAIKHIAQVGGYLARKSDGPPGMKNLWRGLTKVWNVMQYNEIINNV